jgi:hypothetical protein
MDQNPDEHRLPPQYSPAIAGERTPSRGQLDRFCAEVLADASLPARLRTSHDTDRFIALVLDIARDRGFHLNAESVRGAMRDRLLGLQGLIESPASRAPLPPPGWLPIRASWQRNQLNVHWAYFGAQRLRDPFYEGDVQRCLLKPFNRLFGYTTPITELAGWPAARQGLPPSGFIFHMSRCGSTLVSQMLAALDRNIVVSEASPIDAVVQARNVRPDLADDRQELWLAGIIDVLGQPRCGGEREYFIKLDSWHSLALPLFRRAFPSVPWIFLYRDPVEVLVSQLKMRGTQTISGALSENVLRLEHAYQPQMTEDYVARVLAKVCEPVARHYSEGGGLLVNYNELPDALWTRILPHFGAACGETDRAAMAAVARYDAKAPSFEFTRDGEAKQNAARAATRAAAAVHLGDLYCRLETLRLGDKKPKNL